MNPLSRQIFTLHREKILCEAAQSWGFDDVSVVELNGFENHIFEVRRDEQPHILRFCHSLHRTVDQVRGELSWLVYLAEHGVKVAAPVADRDGLYHRVIAIEGSYFVASFHHKAPGRAPRRSDYTERGFEAWGELVEKIHRVTRGYEPAEPALRRFHWYEDPTIDPTQYRGKIDRTVLARFADVVECIQTFPVDPTVYGLIHNDVHPGNFFVDGTSLTAFDFDDCHYQFFVNDVAMALFYALPVSGSSSDREAFGRTFLRHFLAGYRRAIPVDATCLQRIPAFLKLREIDLYCQILLHIGDNPDGWAGEYVQGRRERITDRLPVVELDFEDF